MILEANIKDIIEISYKEVGDLQKKSYLLITHFNEYKIKLYEKIFLLYLRFHIDKLDIF